MIKYSRDNIPTSGWADYVRKNDLQAVRIEGCFEVETINGEVRCEDGYLAIDGCGWPYPITVEVFERTYKRRP